MKFPKNYNTYSKKDKIKYLIVKDKFNLLIDNEPKLIYLLKKLYFRLELVFKYKLGLYF